jgi:hypothetical protein
LLAAEQSCFLGWYTMGATNLQHLLRLHLAAARLMLAAVAASAGHAPNTRMAAARRLATVPLQAAVDHLELVVIRQRRKRQRGMSSFAYARELGTFSTLEQSFSTPYCRLLVSSSWRHDLRGIGNMGTSSCVALSGRISFLCMRCILLHMA